MSNFDLTSPTRQAVRGFVVIFAFEALKLFRAFWPMLIILVANRNKIPSGFTIPMVVGLILAILLLHTILYFRNFYFYVDNNQFILKKGYLRKKVLSVPLDRIQSVNTKQNLLQQILNVHSLEIDSAGSVGKELKIYSLSNSYARELTQYLQFYKNTHSTAEQISEEVHNNSKIVLKLNISDLFRVGISQNHLRTGIIIIAFGSQIFGQIKDLFEEKANDYSNSVESFLNSSGIIVFVVLAILFLALSVSSTLALTVIKYYDFTMIKDRLSYRITAGLFNKRNILLPFSKVQQLNWETGPIKKLFGIFKVSFKQAVSKQTKEKQVADAPGCFEEHITNIRQEIFGENLPDSFEKIYSHKRYFYLLWFWGGWVPAVAPSVLYFYRPIWIIAGAAWLILSAVYYWLTVRKRYFQFNKLHLLVGKGSINTVWQQSESFKTQTVDFKQSFLQKRRGLATLRVNNASGYINIPYISEALAYQLFNYLLYHVENSNKKWM